VAHLDRFNAPTSGFIKQVYFLRLRSNPAGNTLVMLHNKAAGRDASLRFSTHALPYLTLWKNLAPKEDGSVTGIEPETNFPNTRRIERKFGRVPQLPSSASYRMTLDFAIHINAKEITTIANQIAAIQGENGS
jgi:hypothetical protein